MNTESEEFKSGYEEGYWTAKQEQEDNFRREVAKQMLPITSNWKLTKGTAAIPITQHAACKLAIEYAEELIKQLKEEKK